MAEVDKTAYATDKASYDKRGQGVYPNFHTLTCSVPTLPPVGRKYGIAAGFLPRGSIVDMRGDRAVRVVLTFGGLVLLVHDRRLCPLRPPER